MIHKLLNYVLLISLGLLNACGSDCEYNVMTVCIVFDNPEVGPPKDYLVDTTHWYFHELENLNGMSDKNLKHTFKELSTIIFTPEVLSFTKPNGEIRKASGLYFTNGVISIWMRSPCLGKTSYFHEVSHHIAFYLFDDYDLQHNNKLWWGDTGYVKQLEQQYIEIDKHYTCIQE